MKLAMEMEKPASQQTNQIGNNRTGGDEWRLLVGPVHRVLSSAFGQANGSQFWLLVVVVVVVAQLASEQEGEMVEIHFYLTLPQNFDPAPPARAFQVSGKRLRSPPGSLCSAIVARRVQATSSSVWLWS